MRELLTLCSNCMLACY